MEDVPEVPVILTYLQPHRTMRESQELIAPIVKYYMRGEPFDNDISTADLGRWILQEWHERKECAKEKQRLYNVLLALAKGELRNWRKHVASGRQFMGRTASTNIWFDAANNPHATEVLDPSARKTSTPRAVTAPKPVPHAGFPFADELTRAFETPDTAHVIRVLSVMIPIALKDVSPFEPVSFTELGGRLLPKDHALAPRVFNLLREMAHSEFRDFVTLVPGTNGRNKVFYKKWHRAKEKEPALTE